MILALVGPPGVGKTSLGESIARALGRKFVRMSLGGVRDEAEIRGHRRTYVGALPGRIVRALRDAGTMNPVILLDEVDKLGSDWRGDPSSRPARGARPGAELDVPRPLPRRRARPLAGAVHRDRERGRARSRRPLCDRLEVIRLDGYTEDEKVAIAEGYLMPRQLTRNGLLDGRGHDHDRRRAARSVADYTREAGVRSLERERRQGAAQGRDASSPAGEATGTDRDRRDRRPGATSAGRGSSPRPPSAPPSPGVATGLAVTGTGGDVLFIEASRMPGKGDADADRPARRRHEGVGRRSRSPTCAASAADLGIDADVFARPRLPRPRARGRRPEGRPVAPASR